MAFEGVGETGGEGLPTLAEVAAFHYEGIVEGEVGDVFSIWVRGQRGEVAEEAFHFDPVSGAGLASVQVPPVGAEQEQRAAGANKQIGRIKRGRSRQVADFGPGHDAEKQFIKTFTEKGGEIVGQVRTPVSNPDFSPFLSRVKDSGAEAVFLFVPAGEQGVSFLKGYKQRGLDKANIKLIAPGDLTDEDVLDAMGDDSIGVITSMHYSEAHDSELNKKYVQDYYKAYPSKRPNFMSVAGYDGMKLIYSVLEKTKGDASGDAFIAAAKGMSWESPRGQVTIDPETRDIVQDVYIREVKKTDGTLQNVEFDAIKQLKDPGKAEAK